MTKLKKYIFVEIIRLGSCFLADGIHSFVLGSSDSLYPSLLVSRLGLVEGIFYPPHAGWWASIVHHNLLKSLFIKWMDKRKEEREDKRKKGREWEGRERERKKEGREEGISPREVIRLELNREKTHQFLFSSKEERRLSVTVGIYIIWGQEFSPGLPWYSYNLFDILGA